MKTMIQSTMLAALVFLTGIVHSHNTLLDEYGNQIKGIAYVTCEIGIISTTIMQSSSLVSVITISFISAG